MGFVEFFNRPFPLTESVPLWAFCLLVLLVSGITEGLKIPIKLLTNKIQNDKTRHRVNMVIIAVPVGIGILAFYIISYLGYNLSTKAILYDGAYCGKSAVVLYEVISRVVTIVIKKKKDNGSVTAGDVLGAVADGVLNCAQTVQQVNEVIDDIKTTVGDFSAGAASTVGETDGKAFDINKIVGDILDKYAPKDEGESK